MSEPLRVCLFNPDNKLPLHQPFEQIPKLLIVGRCGTWDELQNELRHSPLDAVAVNLDCPTGMDMVQRASIVAPGCGIIGISQNSEPAMIIRAMRAGCSQFVQWPVDISDLTQAIDQVRSAVTFRRSPSKRVCVIGSSGGSGATTVACNLAIELAHMIERPCALVDLNLEFGDVGCVFDCDPPYNVSDLCREEVGIDNLLLEKAFHALPSNVSVLVSPKTLAQAREVTPEGVLEMLEAAGRMFPHIVIDLPRTIDATSFAAISDANQILIVAQLGVSFIRNATRIYEFLCELGVNEERIQIILNRHKANFQSIEPDDVASHFGKPIFGIIPNDYKRVQASLDHGHPIMADEPNSPARLAIQEIARTLAGDDLKEVRLRNPSGLFNRLFKSKKPAATVAKMSR